MSKYSVVKYIDKKGRGKPLTSSQLKGYLNDYRGIKIGYGFDMPFKLYGITENEWISANQNGWITNNSIHKDYSYLNEYLDLQYGIKEYSNIKIKPYYEIIGIIQLYPYTDNYYFLLCEIPQKITLIDNYIYNLPFDYLNVNIYSPFKFDINGSADKNTFDVTSNGIIDDNILTEKINFSNYTEFKNKIGIIYYDNKDISNVYRFTSSGIKVLLCEPRTSQNLIININVKDFVHREYSIEEKDEKHLEVYTGQEVDNSFYNSFRLVYIETNADGIQRKTIIQNSLNSNYVYPKIWNSSYQYPEFYYTYNSQRIWTNCKHEIIQLKKEDFFNIANLKIYYGLGETLKLNEIETQLKNIDIGIVYSNGRIIQTKYNNDFSSVNVTCNDFDGNEILFDNINYIGKKYRIVCSFDYIYFGRLNYSYEIIVTEQITDNFATRAELVNSKINFNAEDIIDFGDEAKINLYNQSNECVQIISKEDFSKIIKKYPNYYGDKINNHKDDLYVDNFINLPIQLTNNIIIDWKITIDYIKSYLTLNLDKVQIIYTIDSESDFNLNTDNLIATAYLHKNSEYLGSVHEIDVSNKVIFPKLNINLNETQTYLVSVIYNDTQYGDASAQYTIAVGMNKPVSIIAEGQVDMIKYYDNGKALFKYPNGIIFKYRYSNNSTEVISPINLQFYRYKDGNGNLKERLYVGVSSITKAYGNNIYVYDIQTKTTTNYEIDFIEDVVQSVYINQGASIVLGNKFSALENFKLKASYESGNIEDVLEYSFKTKEIILQPTDVIVIINNIEYTIDKREIEFIKPEIKDVIVDISSFPTIYNNKTDKINGNNLALIVEYESAEFKQICEFSSSNNPNVNTFIMSSIGMNDYVFDGSNLLNITMIDSVEEKNIDLKTINYFDETKEVLFTQKIIITEISEIVGIRTLNVDQNHYIGETFLNENDETKIEIFYKNNNGDLQSPLTISLNNRFSLINIYPTIGTKFYTIMNNYPVRISSVINPNVFCEYSINVNQKIVSSIGNNINLVVVKVDNLILPNKTIKKNVYALVESENTKINSEGKRVLIDNRFISSSLDETDVIAGKISVKAYGYLDNVFEEDKNAVVVLFDDYVPPIEGSNNIKVTYPCYIDGNADKINKCKFGILFGNNNAKNRLFLSGNNDYKNCDWHSGQVSNEFVDNIENIAGNFGYFEDTSYCYYGETDNAIIGYDIISNDKLLVLKNKSDKETTIYFRTPVLMSAIDGAGTSATNIDGSMLYQEEFSLSMGNNTTSGINPNAIVNFNGDCLFLSGDNTLQGLDLIGIIGDNQRYANTRSYYIDANLKKYNLEKSWLWCNNNDLYIILDDKIFVTNYNLKYDNQYEWFVVNIPNISSIIEINNKLYFANNRGGLYISTNEYEDIEKIFVGEGGSMIITPNYTNDNIEISSSRMLLSDKYIDELDIEKNKYFFKIIPILREGNSVNEDKSSLYYQIATIKNTNTEKTDFYIHDIGNSNYVLELSCFDENGNSDINRINSLTKILSDSREVYLNYIEDDSVHEIQLDVSNSNYNPDLGKYYKKYYLKLYQYNDNGSIHGDYYKLYDEQNIEVKVDSLTRAALCYKANETYEMKDIDKYNNTFSLYLDDYKLNVVLYGNQIKNNSYKGNIIWSKPVEAYYMTKPFTLGSLNYFKTIWQYSLTNDTNIPSELELCYVSNKVPFESMKSINKISKDSLSFDFNQLSFSTIDFDKNIVPRTYTNARVISNVKFISFGFRNYNPTNSVLSSLSILYTIPFPSYSGD